MKVTDYIISYLIEKGVTDIFGYPGGVICHLMDSASKYQKEMNAHSAYHEQGAAFAACGYSQAANKLGVAYATSGPGATNLMTGIANAYFDSIPTLFITGQVDTYAAKGMLPVRQRGFQETDVVSMTESITKYTVNIDSPLKIKYCLEKAYWIATHGNPGPVLLDIPADVQRAEVEVDKLEGYIPQEKEQDVAVAVETIIGCLQEAKRPCLLVGNGVKQAGQVANIRKLIEALNIPTVFSMPAFDVLPYEHPLNFGFIGANGHRYGNFVLGKSDLILTIGSRLDLKQVGNNRTDFASGAKLVRIDIDRNELAYKVHDDELQVEADMKVLVPLLLEAYIGRKRCDETWVSVCKEIRKELQGIDDAVYNKLIAEISRCIPAEADITADVGQSEVWLAQSFQIKEGQRVHLSAGHGAMGYSLPAAIGVYYGAKRPVYCFSGDGGIQMNIQELQFLRRERIPVKVIILNNYALGMIRGFQEANFDKNYVHTTDESGYSAPDFKKLADAYDLPYTKIEAKNENEKLCFRDNEPEIIEVCIPMETSLIPNFGRNGLIQDQRPYMERELFERLMKL